MTPSVEEIEKLIGKLSMTTVELERIELQKEAIAAARQLAKKENNIEEFCWGRKYKLEQKEPSYIVDKLSLKQGGYSSIHSHQVQYNFMYVLFGRIRIEVFHNDAKTIFIEKDLSRNEYMQIGPQRFHRFKALEDSLVIEIITSDYQNIVSRDDIIRVTERGIA